MRRAVLALGVWSAAVAAEAADKRLLEAAEGYLLCAAFYKGVMDAGQLPKGRSATETHRTVARAAEVATGLGITAREGPRRMTADELDTTHRLVAIRAEALARDFRADPRGSRRWIAESLAHCDDKMRNVGG